MCEIIVLWTTKRAEGGGRRCYFHKAHGYVSFFLNGNFCPEPSNLALLVLSIGHRKIFLKLTFRVLALCHVLHWPLYSIRMSPIIATRSVLLLVAIISWARARSEQNTLEIPGWTLTGKKKCKMLIIRNRNWYILVRLPSRKKLDQLVESVGKSWKYRLFSCLNLILYNWKISDKWGEF